MALFDEIDKITEVNALVDREIGKTANQLIGNSFDIPQQAPLQQAQPQQPVTATQQSQQTVPNIPVQAPVVNQQIPQGQVTQFPVPDRPVPQALQDPQGPSPIGSREELHNAISQFQEGRDPLLDILGGVVGAITKAQFGTNLGNIIAPNYFANRQQEAQRLNQAQDFFGAGGRLDQLQQQQQFQREQQDRGAQQQLASNIFLRGAIPQQVQTGSTSITTGVGGGGSGAAGAGAGIPDRDKSLKDLTDFIRTGIGAEVTTEGGVPSLDAEKRKRLFGTNITDRDLDAILSGNVERILPLAQQGKLGGSFGGRLISLASNVQRAINPAGEDILLDIPEDVRAKINEQQSQIISNFPDIFNIDTEGLPSSEIIQTTDEDGNTVSQINPFSQTGQAQLQQKEQEIIDLIEQTEKNRESSVFVSGPKSGDLPPQTVKRLREQRSKEVDKRIADLRKQQSLIKDFQQTASDIPKAEAAIAENRRRAFSGEIAREQLSNPELRKRLGLGGTGAGGTRTTRTQKQIEFQRSLSEPGLQKTIQEASRALKNISF